MTQKTGEIHQRTFLTKLWVSKLCFMTDACSSRFRHVRAKSPLKMGELHELAPPPDGQQCVFEHATRSRAFDRTHVSETRVSVDSEGTVSKNTVIRSRVC